MEDIQQKIIKLEINHINEKIKPIIKWVGGKTQIIDNIISNFPSKIDNYHELFIGGGSILISLLENKNIKISGTINAYDINTKLIILYKIIQTNPIELYNTLDNIILKFKECPDIKRTTNNPLTIEEAMLSKENYYYWIRKQFNLLDINDNTNNILISSYFIFLNKTCFRGLYREGPNGFNVPYGNYKNPEIINYVHLLNLSKLIKNVNFYNLDFSESIKKIKNDDFTYLDPPYYPINDNSFVKYNIKDFDITHHKELFSYIHILNKKNIKFILSNSDTTYINNEFKNYNITKILCRRNINSKNPNSKIYEVLIKNF